jgi:hypothetical protein
MLNTFITLFILGWVLVLILVVGETYAINNPYSKFTMWWRKHVVGKEQ